MNAVQRALQDTPIVIRWAYRTVNGIFVCVMLSIVVLVIREGLSQNTLNSTAGWITGYAWIFGLMLAAVLFVLLLIHAVEARTMALLKWPFALLVLTLLSLGFGKLVYDR